MDTAAATPYVAQTKCSGGQERASTSHPPGNKSQLAWGSPAVNEFPFRWCMQNQSLSLYQHIIFDRKVGELCRRRRDLRMVVQQFTKDLFAQQIIRLRVPEKHRLWGRPTPEDELYRKNAAAIPHQMDRCKSVWLNIRIVSAPLDSIYETFPVTESDVEKKLNAAIGTACWIFAGVFSALVFADRCTSLLRLPDFWYQTRSFHVLMCVGPYVAGWMALRNSRESEQQSSVAPMFNSVTLYTRPGCELCDKAMGILNRFADRLPTINVVNIDDDPELQDLHRDCIPVVEIDGRVYFRGIVNSTLLERMILAREDRQRSESVSPDGAGQVNE